ncbi:MAG TPA: helix-turn-helix transcriptional regulator [Solirubrobacterales bacterium]|jgi:transcriptional regulator with XRE-family HTH domain|nr:helix-turn-helix transcriptional regulator [Solirubrobacterales bacterium]
MEDEFAASVAARIGRRIRRRRRALELSQENLGERAGIHHTPISLYEHGERMPLTSTLIKLAAGLGVSVGQLVAGIEWEPKAGPPLPGPDEGDPDG